MGLEVLDYVLTLEILANAVSRHPPNPSALAANCQPRRRKFINCLLMNPEVGSTRAVNIESFRVKSPKDDLQGRVFFSFVYSAPRDVTLKFVSFGAPYP